MSGFKVYANFIVSVLEKLDRFFAFKVTYRNLFYPLYGDRSVFGYVFGFIFRIWRLFLAIIFYIIFGIIAIIAFLFWCAIPLYIIYKIAYYSPALDILGVREKINL